MTAESDRRDKQNSLARRYLNALEQQIEGKIDEFAIRELAAGFTSLDLDALDIAGIHDQSLSVLFFRGQFAVDQMETIYRGKTFFGEVIHALREGEHPLPGADDVNDVITMLTSRINELNTENQRLREEVAHRKAGEESLRSREMTSNQLLGKSRAMEEEQRLLSRSLLASQEDEQQLISRELNDVIAQAMIGINVRLAALRSQTTAYARDLHHKIAMTEQLAEKSVEIVHKLASELHSTVLEDFGLIPALQTDVEAFTERTGIPVALSANSGVEELAGASRTALYRIALEALDNIARHAKATRAKVQVERLDSSICMKISDNGCGFPLTGEELPGAGMRLGLLGIKERAEMAGGTFQIESYTGEETTIRVEIPQQDLNTDGNPTNKLAPAPLIS